MFDLKKNLLVLLCLCLCLGLPQTAVWGYVLTGTKWVDGDLPVPYYINSAGSDDIGDGTDFTAVQNSFTTWTNVSTTYATVSYQGTTAIEGGAGGAGGDGFNVMSWAESAGTAYSAVSGSIAVSITWSLAGNNLDSDIIFNGNIGGTGYSWSTTVEALKMDIQNIATHEIGHFFGVDHSAVANATMWPTAANGETLKRDLHQDDIDAITVLYPYSGIVTFSASPVAIGDASWIMLSWTNPSKSTFTKVMIRYRTDGVYPATTSAGTLLVEKNGTVAANDYYSHTGVSGGTTYYYSIFAFDTDNGYNAVNSAAQKTSKVIGSGGKIGGGGGNCFIATAGYGNPDTYQVKILRNFRDRVLLKSPWGQNFIKLYYLTSPNISLIISKNEQLKAIVRFFIEPLVTYINFQFGGN